MPVLTVLTTGLTQSQAVTSLAVNPVYRPIAGGETIIVGLGGTGAFSCIVAGLVHAGATTIPIQSATPTVSLGPDTPVWDSPYGLIAGEVAAGNYLRTVLLDGVGLTNLQTVNAFGQALVDSSGQKNTFSAGVAASSIGSTPTDIFGINGSATKTVRVRRIALSGQNTTAAALYDVILIKRSAANGAASSNPAAVPHDSGQSAAATAVVSVFNTTAPSVGAAVGSFVRAAKLMFAITGTANNGLPIVWDFSNRGGKGIVLNGVAEGLFINMNGDTLVNTPTFSADIEWTEE